jgi:hypothetical protein
MAVRFPGIALGVLILALLSACNESAGSAGSSGTLGTAPFQVILIPPANAEPTSGQRVVFQVQANRYGTTSFQWLRNGQNLPGATSSQLILDPVTSADAGDYQVQVSDGVATLLSGTFDLEPVDRAWLVTSAAGTGPGTLAAVLAEANAGTGVNGIQFALPGQPGGELPLVDRPDLAIQPPPSNHIVLQQTLPPITGSIRILGPADGTLVLDGGGVCRPFFVDGGTLVLDHFTVSNGLAKGGDSPGGGGGAGGMGGGMFINKGSVTLRRMLFQGNQAVGGASSPGTDGERGGGGGFGGDSAACGTDPAAPACGNGGSGGLLGGTGGLGNLNGAGVEGGSPGIEGAGGGAARGGPRAPGSFLPWTDNLAGGNADWDGGGGFSVGPQGGGGDATGIGGGGGGSGGRIAISLFPPGQGFAGLFPGAARGAGAFFGGDGSKGDGIKTTGQGGGGGGMGGAVFLRAGTLTLDQCRFVANAALPGAGAEPGLGKGGALFIYAFPYATDASGNELGYDQAPGTGLQTTQFSLNTASDAGVEDNRFDNDNYYIAQTIIAAVERGSPLALLYRRYRLERNLGLTWVAPEPSR